MKNTIKLFGIIVFITIIGFLMAACDDDNGSNTGHSLLDGVWERNGYQITVSGSTGVTTNFGSPSGYQLDAINKGYIKLNSPRWRDIKNIGNLTWAGQQLNISYNSDGATGTVWKNCTFKMSADEQTVVVTTPDDGNTYNWIRKQ